MSGRTWNMHQGSARALVLAAADDESAPVVVVVPGRTAATDDEHRSLATLVLALLRGYREVGPTLN